MLYGKGEIWGTTDSGACPTSGQHLAYVRTPGTRIILGKTNLLHAFILTPFDWHVNLTWGTGYVYAGPMFYARGQYVALQDDHTCDRRDSLSPHAVASQKTRVN